MISSSTKCFNTRNCLCRCKRTSIETEFDVNKVDDPVVSLSVKVKYLLIAAVLCVVVDCDDNAAVPVQVMADVALVAFPTYWEPLITLFTLVSKDAAPLIADVISVPFNIKPVAVIILLDELLLTFRSPLIPCTPLVPWTDIYIYTITYIFFILFWFLIYAIIIASNVPYKVSTVINPQ